MQDCFSYFYSTTQLRHHTWCDSVAVLKNCPINKQPLGARLNLSAHNQSLFNPSLRRWLFHDAGDCICGVVRRIAQYLNYPLFAEASCRGERVVANKQLERLHVLGIIDRVSEKMGLPWLATGAAECGFQGI